MLVRRSVAAMALCVLGLTVQAVPAEAGACKALRATVNSWITGKPKILAEVDTSSLKWDRSGRLPRGTVGNAYGNVEVTSWERVTTVHLDTLLAKGGLTLEAVNQLKAAIPELKVSMSHRESLSTWRTVERPEESSDVYLTLEPGSFRDFPAYKSAVESLVTWVLSAPPAKN